MSEECTASETTDTFLDRWGHFIIWMGPYITIVALIAGTLDFVILLVGVESLHFFIHIEEMHKGRHPFHQLWILVLATTAFATGVVTHADHLVEIAVLIVVQVCFSESVHWNIHADRGNTNWGLTATIAVVTVVLLFALIADGIVPGALGLKACLVTSR